MSFLGPAIAATVGAGLLAAVVDANHRKVAAFVGALGGAAVLYAIDASAASAAAAAAGPGIPMNARAHIVAPTRPGAV